MSQQPPPVGPSQPESPATSSTESTAQEMAAAISTSELSSGEPRTTGESKSAAQNQDEPLEAQGADLATQPTGLNSAAPPSDATVAPRTEPPTTVGVTAAPAVSPSVANPLPAEVPVVPSAPSVPNGAPIPEALIPAAPRPSGIPTDDIVYTPYALSMGDGFKFGCGMVLSLVVTVMIVVLIVALGFLIASLAGVALPIGSLGR